MEPTLQVEQRPTAAVPRWRPLAARAAVLGLVLALVLLVGGGSNQVGSLRRLSSMDHRRATAQQWVGPVKVAGGAVFQLTQQKYTDDKHQDACTSEFASDWGTADWDFDLLQLSNAEVENLCDRLGIKTTFNSDNFFVSRGGRDFFFGRRAYFFERHDGHPPSNWLAHDIHGAITLGSWFGIRGPVLCKKGPAMRDVVPVTPGAMDLCGDIPARRVFDVQWSGDETETVQHCSGFAAPFNPDVFRRLSVDRERDSFRLGRVPDGSYVLQQFDRHGKLKDQLSGGKVKLGSKQAIFYIIRGWFATVITRSDKYEDGGSATFAGLTRDPKLKEC